MLYGTVMVLVMLFMPKGSWGWPKMCVPADAPQPTAPPTSKGGRMSLLTVSKLTKHFGGLTAVNNSRCSIDEGEIVGLIARTEPARRPPSTWYLAFLCPALAMSPLMARSDGLKPHQGLPSSVSTRTFQVVQPFPDMTALENAMMGAFVRHANPAQARAKARQAMERVGMTHKARRLARDLTLMESSG